MSERAIIEITQSCNDFKSTNESGKPMEARLREDATQLRRYRIGKKDKLIKTKRFRNSKKRVTKKEVRFVHGSSIFVVDEFHSFIE